MDYLDHKHRQTDRNLVLLTVYVRDLRRELEDIGWEDRDYFRMLQLQKRIDYACEMIDKGDVYMPLF